MHFNYKKKKDFINGNFNNTGKMVHVNKRKVILNHQI